MKIADVLRLSDSGLRPADLRLILSYRIGFSIPELQIRSDWDIPSEIADCLMQDIERLKSAEPPQYIIGEVNFLGFDLFVTPDVLIPRPETERLVEIALDYPELGSMMDVGTGSGAIAIALKLSRPEMSVFATDISDGALFVAKQNSERHGAAISFYLCDLFPESAPKVNAIISNPPYISSIEYVGLDPMVRDHEPRLALLAEDKGLACYRRLFAGARDCLLPGGMVFLEHGHTQREDIVRIADHHGFACLAALKDYNDYDRYLVMQAG